MGQALAPVRLDKGSEINALALASPLFSGKIEVKIHVYRREAWGAIEFKAFCLYTRRIAMINRTWDFRNTPSATASERVSVSKPVLGRGRRILRGFFGFVFGVFLFSIAVTLFYGWVPVPLTPLMGLRVVESLMDGRPVHFQKDWVSLEEISPRVEYAVIAAEDMRFFEHHGFDFVAIEKALKHNRKSRRIRGGSTISQQVAKNVFLWPSRSWIRKGVEAYFTGLIELFWSKQRIMEVYLNVVEMGDGVYGVEAAARKYFHKPAKNLNASEAALLAAVLPNPRRFLVQRPSGYVRFRQTAIRRRMASAALTVPKH